MQLKHLMCAAAVTLIAILACQKEVSFTNTPVTGTPNQATVTAVVVGRIIDENSKPVVGALVKAGTAATHTNVNGEFRINNATVKEKTAFVTVEKGGYFKGSRTFIARAGQKHYVEIQLLPKNNAGTISGAAGGNITLTDGTAISLPAGAVVVKSSGATYTGSVQVAMQWIDPTIANLPLQMPGDLRGINNAGNEVGLQTFGMIGVELTSPSGEALQIATGKKATLTFPLPPTFSSIAPASIPLWWFNDSTGLWKQEGAATKTGNTYIAEVSHFSFWNCDAPFPVVNFTVRFVNQNGQPLQHTLVKLKRTNNNSYTSGWTDSTGTVTGLIPGNEPLIMSVYANSSCNQAIYTQNIGPFNAATNLGTITVTLTAANTFTFAGTVVNCSSAPVASGYVELNAGTRIYRASLVNGAFTLTFPSCASSQSITYFAVDSTNGQQSAPVTATFNGGANNLGAISACGLSTQRFVNFTLNGTAYSITSPPDSTTGMLSQGRTYISGMKNMGATSATYFDLSFTGNTVGSLPVTSIYVRTPTFTDSTVLQPGTMVNITEYGAIGAYIGGTLTTTLNGSGSATHTLQCTFRVRRNN